MSNEILISGNSGFIGKNLTIFLKKKKLSVVDFEKRKNKKYKQLVYLKFFISKNKTKNFNKNLKYSKKILNFSKKTKTDILFISTHLPLAIKKNYNQLNDYQKAKYRIEELLLKEKNFKIKILRLPNVYGPGSKYGVVSDLLNNFLNKKKIYVKNSNNYREFLYINDVCRIIYKSIYLNKSFSLFAGSGYKVKIEKLATIIGREFKNKIIIFDKKKDQKNKLSFSNKKFNKIFKNFKFSNLKKNINIMIKQKYPV